jgi:hypothetical protein
MILEHFFGRGKSSGVNELKKLWAHFLPRRGKKLGQENARKARAIIHGLKARREKNPMS